MKGKKGNYQDVGTYLATAIVLFVVISVTLTVIDRFNTNFQGMDENTVNNASKTVSTNFKDSSFKFWDLFFALLLISFIGFSVIASRLIPSQPVFIIFTFFVLLVLPFLAMIGEEIWDAYKQSPVMTGTLGQMTLLPFILDYLVIITIVYILIIAIALLTKEEGGL